MKRVEIHPDTFLFMEVAEIKPSLDMVLHTEEPGSEILTFDFISSTIYGIKTMHFFYIIISK